MAENKKSFLLYADYIELFEELEDEDAGKLIKHILRYVNDLNPEAPKEVKSLFILIKQQLKRDLEKWDVIREKRSKAGKASAEAKKQNSTKSTSVERVEQTSTKSTVNVTVNDNVINNSLLSEIDISEVELGLVEYFKIAKEFQRLFIQNLKERNAPTNNQEKATFKNYVTPIRLMMQNKEATKQDLVDVWVYLNSYEGEFWKKNILSTSKLREQIQKLIMSAREYKSKPKLKEDKL